MSGRIGRKRMVLMASAVVLPVGADPAFACSSHVKNFMTLCASPVRSIDELREPTSAEGWQWLESRVWPGAEEGHYSIRSPEDGRFLIDATAFSDRLVFDCKYIGSLSLVFSPISLPPSCPDLPEQIAERLPTAAVPVGNRHFDVDGRPSWTRSWRVELEGEEARYLANTIAGNPKASGVWFGSISTTRLIKIGPKSDYGPQRSDTGRVQ